MPDFTATPERWLPVPGYEGFYEVSDRGGVRSVDRAITRKGRKASDRVRRAGGVLNCPQDQDGYPRASLSRDNRRCRFYVHVLVLEAFVGPRPEGMECLHGDGDPSNNRLCNLHWDTPSENQLDRVRHGRHFATSRLRCPRGHRLMLPNLDASQWARGWRTCLACKRTFHNQYSAQRAGRPFDFAGRADEHYAKIMGESAA